MSDEIESALEAQIDPWLAHMRWRADFDQWRERRIWQEKYQERAVAEVLTAARRFKLGEGGAARLRVLDLGAGMGGFAVALARAGADVTALDYNLAYCEITRTRARRYDLDLPALAGAGEALPFSDRQFEVVTCWDVIEHVQAPARLLGEVARVTTEKGIVFVTVINRLALVDPHYHLRFVNWVPRPIGEKWIAWRQRTKASPLRDRQKLGEMHYFTYGRFEQLARQFGFHVADLNRAQSRFNRYPPPLGGALYGAWRALGMGTFRLMLVKG